MIDDLGLLAARLVLGASYASHGAQKAFGWFGGPGPEKAGGFMESLGLKPGTQYAALAAYGEIAAGMMIALGAGGPSGPAVLISGMIVAQETVHKKNGYFAQQGGIELGVIYSAGALAVASAGYGALSLDRLFGLHRPLSHPALKTLALAGAVASGYAVLGRRDFTPPEGTLATPTIPGNRSNGAASNGTSSGAAEPAKS